MCDTGVGMSEEDVAVALTPFGQVDASHARWREGTGLGLPIAGALVQLHDGELQHPQPEGQRHGGDRLAAARATNSR